MIHIVLWNSQCCSQQVIEFDTQHEANHTAQQINETYEDSPLCCLITKLFGPEQR